MKKIQSKKVASGRKSVERYISHDSARNKYYVCLNYGMTEDGLRNVKKYVTRDSLKDARQVVHDFYSKKDKGLVVMPAQITFVQWLKLCVDNMRVGGNSESYCYQLKLMISNHIEPFFGEKELQKIQSTDIERYAKHIIDKGLDINTYIKHYDFILQSLDKACEREMVLKNVCKQVQRPKKKRAEMPFYTSEQVGSLVMSVMNTDMELFVYLLVFCGLRRGEALGLTWNDVDFEKNTIYIRRSTTTAGKVITKSTKTKSSERILGGLPKDLMDSLRKEYDRQKKLKEEMGDSYPVYDYDFVLRLANGRRLRPTYASDKFKKIIEDNNLPPLSPHGCRHSYASIANDQGMTMYDISRALGHTNISTTAQIYTDLFKQDNSKTICAVSAAIDQCVI